MKRAEFWIVCLFLIMLWLPLLGASGRIRLVEQIQEERSKAKLPEFSWVRMMDFPNTIGKEFTAFLEDRMGLRDLFIRTYTQINYSLFGVSDKVYLGKDGWLFYRHVVDDELPRIDHLPKTTLEAGYKKIDRLANYLNERGIRLILLYLPMKATIYPEMLPNNTPLRPQIDHLLRVNERLTGRNEFDFIETYNKLMGMKEHRKVYHKTDFHWTDITAGHVAREIVDKIGQREGHQDETWQHAALEIENIAFIGGEARWLPMLWYPREVSDFVKVNWTDNGSWERRKVTRENPFEGIYSNTAQGGAKLLPPTAWHGTSFSDGMIRAGTSIHFEKLYRSRVFHAPLQLVLKKLPKDVKYMVFESVEVRDWDMVIEGIPE